MTIVEFLEQRIAEDEEWAMTSASTSTPGSFARDNYGALLIQPTRVMAECTAKRKIVADRVRIDRSANDDEWSMGYSDANYSAVRALAAVDADHPDYQAEWRP